MHLCVLQHGYRLAIVPTYVSHSIGVASFTILVWDHIITFSDEVTFHHVIISGD
jgi:hypothetical protein